MNLEEKKQMKKMDFQKVVEWLSHILKCPVCAYKYNLERTKIIDAKEGENNQASLFVHSDCAQCKSSVVFSISINGPDVYVVNMLTDLTSEDTEKFSGFDSLSTDEVLDVHKFLGKFDGDFVKMFEKEKA
jgi:hypothetical protein